MDGSIEILYAKMKEKIARQNIKANGETLDRDFVSFCMPYLPEVQNEMQASQNEMSKTEKRVTSPQFRSFVIGKKIYRYAESSSFYYCYHSHYELVLGTGAVNRQP